LAEEASLNATVEDRPHGLADEPLGFGGVVPDLSLGDERISGANRDERPESRHGIGSSVLRPAERTPMHEELADLLDYCRIERRLARAHLLGLRP
jgi:hypothetical protein